MILARYAGQSNRTTQFTFTNPHPSSSLKIRGDITPGSNAFSVSSTVSVAIGASGGPTLDLQEQLPVPWHLQRHPPLTLYWGNASSPFQTETYSLRGRVSELPSIQYSGSNTYAELGEHSDFDLTVENRGSQTFSIQTYHSPHTNPDSASSAEAPQLHDQRRKSRTWRLRYEGSTRGTHQANLKLIFSYDGLDYDGGISLPIEGQTYLAPELSVSGTNPDATVGNPVDFDLTLHNNGSLSLSLDTAAARGADAAQFQLLPRRQRQHRSRKQPNLYAPLPCHHSRTHQGRTRNPLHLRRHTLPRICCTTRRPQRVPAPRPALGR